jgi:hypothetical protein
MGSHCPADEVGRRRVGQLWGRGQPRGPQRGGSRERIKDALRRFASLTRSRLMSAGCEPGAQVEAVTGPKGRSAPSTAGLPPPSLDSRGAAPSAPTGASWPSARHVLARPDQRRARSPVPDGAPQNSVMWFAWDGAHVHLAHSRRGRKFRNVTADPRVSVSLADPENPYRSLEIRGVVASIADDPGGALFLPARPPLRLHGSHDPGSGAPGDPVGPARVVCDLGPPDPRRPSPRHPAR